MCSSSVLTNETYSILIFYSPSYPFEHDLKGNQAKKGSNITLSIDLIGGKIFKIIGMMLCSS